MIETVLDQKTTNLTTTQRLSSIPMWAVATGAEAPQDSPAKLSPVKCTHKFNDLLVEVIDETIISLLSVQVAEALYSHLEKHHSIGKDEIPYRLDTLSSTFQGIFGSSSRIVEKAIAKRFYFRLDFRFDDKPTKRLVEYVEQAKLML